VTATAGSDLPPSPGVRSTPWWKRVLRRRGGVDAQAARPRDWTTLRAVVDEAVALQPGAEQAIRACGGDDEATGDMARRASDLAGAYLALRQRLPSGTGDEYLSARVAQVDRLLHTHQWLLSEAVHMRFSVAPNARRADFARRFTGLGAAAGALARLREQLNQDT
jgi:hypothetical protein